MEYHPKHPQPFSFSEALQLDPGTITEEIARLQNSLKHLKETQDELRPLTDDPELAQALRENEAVIASQEERINMLNVALIEKGVIASGGHYELKQTPVTDAQQSPAARLDPHMDELNEDSEGGVVL